MAEARNFTDYIDGRILPRWMLGELGHGFVGVTIEIVADACSDALTAALRAPWLADDMSPDDALPRIGREQRMPRYPSETPTQYRARLLQVFDLYSAGGDEDTILGQLGLAGMPGARIYDSFNADFSPPDYWSKFLIYFPIGTHPVTAPAPKWATFNWGDGTSYGPVGLSRELAGTIRGIVRKWKSVRWICRYVVFQISGWNYGTGKRWGEPGLKWGASSARMKV